MKCCLFFAGFFGCMAAVSGIALSFANGNGFSPFDIGMLSANLAICSLLAIYFLATTLLTKGAKDKYCPVMMLMFGFGFMLQMAFVIGMTYAILERQKGKLSARNLLATPQTKASCETQLSNKSASDSPSDTEISEDEQGSESEQEEIEEKDQKEVLLEENNQEEGNSHDLVKEEPIITRKKAAKNSQSPEENDFKDESKVQASNEAEKEFANDAKVINEQTTIGAAPNIPEAPPMSNIESPATNFRPRIQPIKLTPRARYLQRKIPAENTNVSMDSKFMMEMKAVQTKMQEKRGAAARLRSPPL